MVRTLAVTGANEPFVPLLRELVGSLRQWKTTAVTDLACFDLGLSEASRIWIGSEARHVREPGWDLPVDPELRLTRPHYRGLTVRPFLRDYFPGYDVYLWLDADLWIQRQSVLKDYVLGARGHGLSIATQNHTAYRHREPFVRQRASHLRAYFGEEAAKPLRTMPYYNPGAFAISADAPHWEAWARWFKTGLIATKGRLVNDQTAINHAIWTEKLTVAALSASCNWCCHLALPWRLGPRGPLREPGPRGAAIGIVHLTADTKSDPTLRFRPR